MDLLETLGGRSTPDQQGNFSAKNASWRTNAGRTRRRGGVFVRFRIGIHKTDGQGARDLHAPWHRSPRVVAICRGYRYAPSREFVLSHHLLARVHAARLFALGLPTAQFRLTRSLRLGGLSNGVGLLLG